MIIDHLAIKVCNCAGCGAELMSREYLLTMTDGQRDYPLVFMTLPVLLRGVRGEQVLHRRPHCEPCYMKSEAARQAREISRGRTRR